MFKKLFKRIRINFRSSRSERVAEQSYSNYHKRIKNMFRKATANSKISGKLNKKYD